ncbi:MAG: hypothetical protein E7012_05970 [Alphaproteobacteria bacterium]|nr:hypothetical protein [Alphaproteobacteria bacterium]
MKNLTILTPLVLLTTTTLAQSSTCIVQPSCSQLGYTQVESDCGSSKVIRCPFDVSQVACVSGGNVSGSGDDGNGDTGDTDDAIILKFNVTGGYSLILTYGGGSIKADCGNGFVASGFASNETGGTVKCYFPEAGIYTVKLSGDFTYYGGANSFPLQLIKLNKTGITKFATICSNGTYGEIPPLPSTLVDATKMFYRCTNLYSSGLELPEGLEIADSMFDGVIGVSGEIKLPSTLKSVGAMFVGANGSFSVTGLENTKITDGAGMFRASGVTSVSGLPATLTIGTAMFGNCNSLTTMPNLPSGLTQGNRMFQSCSNLTGTLPDYSNFPNLTNVLEMFDGTQITKDDNPSWPEQAWY